MADTLEVVFHDDGTFGGIYDDRLVEYYETLGEGLCRRASTVEPDDCGLWWVQFAPWVSGAIRELGPFRLRADALAAEVAALKERGL